MVGFRRRGDRGGAVDLHSGDAAGLRLQRRNTEGRDAVVDIYPIGAGPATLGKY